MTWAEGIALSRVEGGEIDYIIAAWARENKVRSPLALAHARKAKDLGVEAEDLDEIVAYLQGNEKASR